MKRFTTKRDKEIIKTNTYLFTLGLPSRPESLKAGYCHLRVDAYIRNPLRCYRCHKYGHGSKSCHNPAACHRCGGTCEDSTLCVKTPSCVNCSGNHPSFSRDSYMESSLQFRLNVFRYHHVLLHQRLKISL